MRKIIFIFLGICCQISFVYAENSSASYEEKKIESVKENIYIDVTYPVIGNKVIDSSIEGYISDLKENFIRDSETILKENSPDFFPTLSLDLSYNIINNTKNVFSIKFDGYVYLGGAHGTPIIQTFNFFMDSGKQITIQKKEHLEKIARLIRPKLNEYLQEIQMSDADWLLEGTAPVDLNYNTFGLKTNQDGKLESISIYFQSYQIAAYAAGTPSITIHRNGEIKIEE